MPTAWRCSTDADWPADHRRRLAARFPQVTGCWQALANLTCVAWGAWLLWQGALEQEAPQKIPLQRLDGATRAKVLAALAGLIILGLGMMALTWLGARVTRRYMNPRSIHPRPRKSSVPADDDWAEKPLIEPLEGDLQNARDPDDPNHPRDDLRPDRSKPA